MGVNKPKDPKKLQQNAKELGMVSAAFQAALRQLTKADEEITRLTEELQKMLGRGDPDIGDVMIKLQAQVKKREQLFAALTSIMKTTQEQSMSILRNIRG